MTTMTKRTPRTIDVLKYTRNLLKDGHWTRGNYAETADGYMVPTYSSNASKFCLAGAIERAFLDLDASSVVEFRALDKLEKIVNKKLKDKGHTIEYYNDRVAKSEADIINILDKAIKG